MPVDQSYIDSLLRVPQESLAVEIKGWFDPKTPEGAAKLVRACIALRNNGGGFLVIGFDNQGIPQNQSRPPDLPAQFHVDLVQGLVTKHAADPFPIEVRWGIREDLLFPVVEVPDGVKYPVAAKSPIVGGDGKILVAEHRVFVRSLQANNTPATTEATYRDWPRITEICFENREADIGRFLRRHLSTPDALAALKELLCGPTGATTQTVDEGISLVAGKPPEESALNFLEESGAKFRSILPQAYPDLPAFGFREAAFVIAGPVPAYKADSDFLNLVMSANPKYTGWPLFLDTRGSPDEAMLPTVEDEIWQSLIVSLSEDMGHEIDFWRADPSGRFYHGRALDDDMNYGAGGPSPLTSLDFGLVVLRAAEAVVLGLEFARAMGAPPEESSVAYAFRWTGLKGRELSSWAGRDRFWPPGDRAFRQEVTSTVLIPLVTVKAAVAEYVHQAVAPLFAGFGTSIDAKPVSQLVDTLLSWRRRR